MLTGTDSPQVGLFTPPLFEGFGPTHLHPQEYQPVTGAAKGSKAGVLRDGVRANVPKLPGVYGMLDRAGRLIYVGKAKILRARLLSYFRTESRDHKAGKILSRSRMIVWESCPNEFSALLRELELIQANRPRFNVIGQPGMRRHIYLCIGRPPAARLYAARQLTGKEQAVFGPFVGANQLNDAIRVLTDRYRLRDCAQHQPIRFADRPNLFNLLDTPGCLRYEIGTCSGPCVGGCTSNGYTRQLREVAKFLEGADAAWLGEMEKQMLEASERLAFEDADFFKQRWAPVAWLRNRLGFLRQARAEHSFVYAAESHDERTVWYAIHRGLVQKVFFEPGNARAKTKTEREVRKVFAEPLRSRMGNFDSVLLVAAWFRRYPAEREKLLGHLAVLPKTAGSMAG